MRPNPHKNRSEGQRKHPHQREAKDHSSGVYIARETAKQNKLPYLREAGERRGLLSSKMIGLSYRIGIISRPEYFGRDSLCQLISQNSIF
jgi:hypothetical protein